MRLPGTFAASGQIFPEKQYAAIFSPALGHHPGGVRVAAGSLRDQFNLAVAADAAISALRCGRGGSWCQQSSRGSRRSARIIRRQHDAAPQRWPRLGAFQETNRANDIMAQKLPAATRAQLMGLQTRQRGGDALATPSSGRQRSQPAGALFHLRRLGPRRSANSEGPGMGSSRSSGPARSHSVLKRCRTKPRSWPSPIHPVTSARALRFRRN